MVPHILNILTHPPQTDSLTYRGHAITYLSVDLRVESAKNSRWIYLDAFINRNDTSLSLSLQKVIKAMGATWHEEHFACGGPCKMVNEIKYTPKWIDS